MQIPFIGGSGLGRSSNIDASRSINFMAEVASQDSKSVVSMIGTPGTKLFCEFPNSPIRMIHTVASRCFVVAGPMMYEVFADATYRWVAELPDSTGWISVADNGASALGVGGDQLCMVVNSNGYIFNFNTGVFEQITDPGFPTNPQNVMYIDGYFIITNNTMAHYTSELYNGLVWPGLAFASAVSTSDPIKIAVNVHQQVLVIKEYVTEIWYNAGVPTSQGSPFQRRAGGVIDYGTSAPWSVARGHNTVFMLANQRNGDSGELFGVVMMNNTAPEIISSPAISYRISNFTTISDAIGYCYADEGHLFYVLTFPTEDATFVYDLTTQMWHERSSYTVPPYQVRRHLSEMYSYFGGKNLVSHYNSGKLVELSTKYYDDDGASIIGIRTAQPIWDKHDLSRMNINKLTIDAEVGVGNGGITPSDPYYAWLADGTHIADGSGFAGGFDMVLSHNGNPQAWLSWSNDNGHTWSNEYPASMGKMGEYHTRMIWRRLGNPRNRTFRLRMVDSVKRIITGAMVNDGAIR